MGTLVIVTVKGNYVVTALQKTFAPLAATCGYVLELICTGLPHQITLDSRLHSQQRINHFYFQVRQRLTTPQVSGRGFRQKHLIFNFL